MPATAPALCGREGGEGGGQGGVVFLPSAAAGVSFPPPALAHPEAKHRRHLCRRVAEPLSPSLEDVLRHLLVTQELHGGIRHDPDNVRPVPLHHPPNTLCTGHVREPLQSGTTEMRSPRSRVVVSVLYPIATQAGRAVRSAGGFRPSRQSRSDPHSPREPAPAIRGTHYSDITKLSASTAETAGTVANLSPAAGS